MSRYNFKFQAGPIRYRSNGIPLWFGLLVFGSFCAAVSWFAGVLFQYSLWSIAGKDVSFFADMLAGLLTSPVLIPVTIVCWILRLAGVAVPFVHA